MEDHVFSEDKEIKKVKKYFSKNKGLVYIFSIVALVFVFSLTLFFVSDNKPKVADLTETDEQSGQYQVSSPSPKCDVQIVMDTSGSMRNIEPDGRQKLAWAKDAATGFVNAMATLDNSNIRLGLTSFGSAEWVSPYGSARVRRSLTSDYSSVNTAISALAFRDLNVGTCIDCGLTASNADIQSVSTDNQALKVVVLLSDGWGNRILSSGNVYISNIANTRAAAIARANAGRLLGIKYYVVGYGDPSISRNYDYGTLVGVANDPDSTYYSYRPSVTEWTQTFTDLAREVCKPVVPDCTNLTADKDLNNLRVGETVNFSVTAGGTAPVTSVAAWVYREPNSCQDSERLFVQYPFPTASGVGTWPAGSWTPTASQVGPFEVFASVWNDGVAECKSDCVDGPPRYLCPSTAANPAICKLSGVVTQPPALSCVSKQAYTSSGVVIDPGTMVQRGTQFRYRVNYRNTSPTAQTNATLTDSLPSGIDYVSTNVGSCTNNNNNITCNLGTVAGNSTGYVEFNVFVNQNASSGSKVNTGVVVPNVDPTVNCSITLNVPTSTPTIAANCATVRINLIKDTPWGNPRQCNGTVDMSCNTDRVTAQTYSYVVDYRDSFGNIQTALRQTGRVTSLNGDLCSNPQNLGYSPEIRLSNMPSGGSARVMLSYVLDPTLMRVLATTNPNTSSSTDDIIVVDNIRAGQSMSVRGHLCVLGICGPSCSTFPQNQPEIVVSTSTTPCN